MTKANHHKAHSQGKHGNLQDLGGVEDPALVNLAVRHIFQNGNKVWQEKDVEEDSEPHDDGQSYVDKPSGSGRAGVPPLSNSGEVVQSSQAQNRPVKRAVDLSEDLNQQTHVKPGELQAQKSEGAAGGIEGANAEGQRRVDDGQRNNENPQEAFGDVVSLEKHQSPVKPTLDSQTEQDGEDG